MANKKNFATGLVATAPDPAMSGTSMILNTGHGARMPQVPFYATAHPADEVPTVDNAEIVLVTELSGNNIDNMERAQRGTTAKAIDAGWRLSNAIYVEDLDNSLGSPAGSKTPKLQTTVLSNMEADWINWYGGTTDFDTTDKLTGNASLKVTIDPQETFSGARLNLPSPLDMSQVALKLRFKMESWSDLTSLALLFFTDSELNDGFAINLRAFFATPADGEWLDVVFPRSVYEAIDSAYNLSTVHSIFLRVGAGVETSVWVDEMALVPDQPRPVVTVSFDDGFDDTLAGAAYMDKYNMRGTAFIASRDVGQSGFMTDAEIRTLADRGWGIGGHWTFIGNMDEQELNSAMREMRYWLTERAYAGIDHFAYPNGIYNDMIKRVVMRYFATARTIDGFNQPLGYVVDEKVNSRTISSSHSLAEVKEWIDTAIENKEWLILNFHKLVASPTEDIEWPIADFEEVVDYLHEEGVLVVPYHEALQLDREAAPSSGGDTNIYNNIYIDQSGGNDDAYGELSGSINGTNKVFTVSQGQYATGTLKVYRNGQLMTQGSAEDYVETTPASGTFTFEVAPESGDEITAEYQLVEAETNTAPSGGAYEPKLYVYLPDYKPQAEIDAFITNEVEAKGKFWAVFWENFRFNTDGSILFVDTTESGGSNMGFSSGNKTRVLNIADEILATVAGDVSGSDGAAAMLANGTLRDNAISAIVTHVTTEGFRGVNINFEPIADLSGTKLTNFRTFIADLRTALDTEDPTLMLTWAGQIAWDSDQPNKEYSAVNYTGEPNMSGTNLLSFTLNDLEQMGFDLVEMQAYDQFYDFGAQEFGITSMDQVSNAIGFAHARLPRTKFGMIISSYGVRMDDGAEVYGAGLDLNNATRAQITAADATFYSTATRDVNRYLRKSVSGSKQILAADQHTIDVYYNICKNRQVEYIGFWLAGDYYYPSER